jgi:hypothetical protein
MHPDTPHQPPSPTAPPTAADASADPIALSAAVDAETKPDPLASLAIDANALARAIWSGRGDDVSRLVADLLKGRDAA